MSTKSELIIHIDEELLKNTKIKNYDDFFETQIRLYLNNDFSEELELLNMIEKKHDELTVLMDRLCELRKSRSEKIEDMTIFDEAMISLNRINENLGMVGKNQIKKFAKKHTIPYQALLNHARECGLNIVNYAEPQKK